MQYNIFGDNLPAVTIRLNQGESVYTQSGGMSWMSNGITMETNMKGGLLKGIGRMLSGESLFMATYTATRDGDEISLAATFPGKILALNIGGGKEYICQKNAFLCATPEVELSAAVVKGASSGLFGGEGFILQHLKGRGMAFVELDGSVCEIELAAGQKIKVDTGHVAIYEPSVSYTVETVTTATA